MLVNFLVDEHYLAGLSLWSYYSSKHLNSRETYAGKSQKAMLCCTYLSHKEEMK